MIRFDPQTREITLAVRDLIYFDSAPPIRPEPSLGLRARAGTEAHQSHRLKAESSGLRAEYQAERPIEYRRSEGDYRVVVQGRIDGLYRENDLWVVEEVKSVILDPALFSEESLQRAVLDEGAFADYRLRLELYVFFYMESLAFPPPPVAGRLVLRNITGGGENIATVEIVPHRETVESWVRSRLERIIERLEAGEEARSARRAAGQAIRFPFPKKRPHQDELLEEVKRALEEGENLLVSAPTGVGKTAAVLCAALKHALEGGLTIFYATSKTTQQRVVVETLERIAARAESGDSERAPPFRAVVLRAKEKICPNLSEEGFIFCHENFCRYARGFRGKLESSGALERLLAGPVALPEAAGSLGQEEEICPFELTMEATLEADVIVGDYNYIFDPQSYLRRFIQERRSRRAILIVDEAHNLYPRGRESHSPAIARRDVVALERWAREREDEERHKNPSNASNQESRLEMYTSLRAWCRKLGDLFGALSSYGRDELGDPPVFPVDLDPPVIQPLSEELEAIRTRKLILDHLSRERAPARARGGLDPLADLTSRWGYFSSALKASENIPSLVLYDRSGPFGSRRAGHRLRILCLNPAMPLGRRIAEFQSTIAISATLEPLEFYREVLGFPHEKTRSLSFPSPFPEENRKILVWDQISTYYRSRSRDASRVAQLIEEITGVEPGNYLACFPSYAYLREVLAHLTPEFQERCIVQSPGMPEEVRDLVLSALRKPGAARTVLAVQGGIFTEGVDYPGRMLIGVIVVGPGLPAVTFEEEQVRDYFEYRYHQGFEYAYLYPGMNRVIQCAGRVIRSEEDVGVIVLLGERFSQRQFASLFPAGWYRSTPRELLSKDLTFDLTEFWKSRRSR